jgi:hypothetical protein
MLTYEGDFWSLCTVTFGPSAHGDTPLPLRHADVLNGWSPIHFAIVIHTIQKPQKMAGQNTFQILFLNDANMIGEH